MRRRSLLLVSLGLLLGLGLASPEWGAERLGGAYASEEADTSGALGLYRLTGRLGRQAVRWDRPLSALEGPGGLVMLCGGRRAGRPLSVYERRVLRAWVASGGRLLAAGCDLEGLFGLSLDGTPGPCELRDGAEPGEAGAAEAGRAEKGAEGSQEQAETADGSTDGTDGSAEAAEVVVLPGCAGVREGVRRIEAGPGPWAGLPNLVVFGPAPVVVADSEVASGSEPDGGSGGESAGVSAADVFARTDQDRPFAVRRTVGAGEVWLLGSAEPLLNGALLRQLGAARFARWLRTVPDGPVRFDVWRLGEGSAPGALGWLARRGGAALWAALLLGLGAALWRSGARLGPVRPTMAEPEEATASLLDALQALYAASRDRDGVVARLRGEALRRLASAWRLHGADAGRLERSLRTWGRTEQAEAVRAIDGLAPPEKDEWAAWVGRLDALVERAMPPGRSARGGWQVAKARSRG